MRAWQNTAINVVELMIRKVNWPMTFIAHWRNVYFCRTLTCAKTMPGSLGYEEQDAKTFASWVILFFLQSFSSSWYKTFSFRKLKRLWLLPSVRPSNLVNISPWLFFFLAIFSRELIIWNMIIVIIMGWARKKGTWYKFWNLMEKMIFQD
jgi:hypothetical protein